MWTSGITTRTTTTTTTTSVLTIESHSKKDREILNEIITKLQKAKRESSILKSKHKPFRQKLDETLPLLVETLAKAEKSAILIVTPSPPPPNETDPETSATPTATDPTPEIAVTSPDSPPPPTPPPPDPHLFKLLPKILPILSLAIASKSSKMSEISLEAYTLLLSNGYIVGDSAGSPSSSLGGGKQPGDLTDSPDSVAAAAAAASVSDAPPPTTIDQIITTISSCSDTSDEFLQTSMISTLLLFVTSGRCGVHEGALLLAIRASFHVFLVCKSKVGRGEAKAALVEMVCGVFMRMEACDAMCVDDENKEEGKEEEEKEEKEDTTINTPTKTTTTTTTTEAQQNPVTFKTQLHKDAFLIFRALCKLSSKSLSDERAQDTVSSSYTPSFIPSPSDPLALHSKALSLELILSILSKPGPAFCTGDKFIYAVRHYLCVSLLKNCMSTNTSIIYLSLRIFITLVHTFRNNLKQEIEVFVANIFLKVLESLNSSYEQKSLVLEALHTICSDENVLSQLFLNYDCDFERIDLFKSIVNDLARVAKGTYKGDNTSYNNATVADLDQASKANTLSSFMAGKGSSAKREAGREAALRMSALEVLIAVLRAMLKAQNLEGGDDQFEENNEGNKTRLLLTTRPVAKGVGVEESEDKDKDNNGGGEGDGSEGSFKSTLTSFSVSVSASNSDDTAIAAVVEQQEEVDVEILTSAASTTTTQENGLVSTFNQKRAVLESFDLGLVKFKLNMKVGISHFIKHKFIDSLNAKSVAVFLHDNKERLDKTMVGEVLGKEPDFAFVKGEDDVNLGGKGFCVQVLHSYVDHMDFVNLEFDVAIRHFLAGFRLPGEAQKIDRIMEKFAERYSRLNASVFPSADTAFILAFSIIMLNTDLHNPSIKEDKRMTASSFIRNNRGINVNQTNLPDDFLEGVFYRIQKTPFTLKEDDVFREKMGVGGKSGEGSSAFDAFFYNSKEEKKRKEEFQKEREEMFTSSEMLMKGKGKSFKVKNGGGLSPLSEGRAKVKIIGDNNSDSNANSNANANAELPERLGLEPTQQQPPSSKPTPPPATKRLTTLPPRSCVAPMFDVAWGPTIGSLSQILEFTSSPQTISLCLRGFLYAVRIASHNDMAIGRDTFVNSLAKFTTLGAVKEIKGKNIECIRALLSMAITDGNNLGEAWGPVLQCISHLAKLQLCASGLATDDELFVSGGEERERERGLNSNDGRISSRKSSMSENYNNGGERISMNSIFTSNKPSKAQASRQLEELNGRALLAEVNELLIDRVFASSVNLSTVGIEHFIGELIRVSASELGATQQQQQQQQQGGNSSSRNITSTSTDSFSPRIFALQKLVEVASLNMTSRPRIVWTRIWSLMASHFAYAGCHTNSMVSMYAIDSLRQLGFKFLEVRVELKDFNFQRLFLRPFLTIMERHAAANSREDVRELILRCIDNMIRGLAKNIRSGWKTIFSILRLSAVDPSIKIASLGLEILQRLLGGHLVQLCSAQEDFMGVCLTALSFVYKDGGGGTTKKKKKKKKRDGERDSGSGSGIGADVHLPQTQTQTQTLAMHALCGLSRCADAIASNTVQLYPVSTSGPHYHYQSDDPNGINYTYSNLDEDGNEDAKQMILWRPIFDGLSHGISHSLGSNLIVQRACVSTLRAILLRHGHMFNTRQYHAILSQSILPSFQHGITNDLSGIKSLYSHSPDDSCGTFSFVRDAPGGVPRGDDEGFLRYAKRAKVEAGGGEEGMGAAEGLVFALLKDLRVNGGDGREGELEEDLEEELEEGDDSFKNSWIKQTAPSAYGMLIDIFSVHIIRLGDDGRTVLFPLIISAISNWNYSRSNRSSSDETETGSVVACEALLRTCCASLIRIPDILQRSQNSSNGVLADGLPKAEVSKWWRHVCVVMADTLKGIVVGARGVKEGVLREKKIFDERVVNYVDGDGDGEVGGGGNGKGVRESVLLKGIIAHHNSNSMSTKVSTAFGSGEIIGENGDDNITIVKLMWGATLYAPSDSIDLLMLGNDGDGREGGEGIRWNVLSDDEGDDETVLGDNDNDRDNDNDHDNETRPYKKTHVIPLIALLKTLEILVKNLSGSMHGMGLYVGIFETEGLLSGYDACRMLGEECRVCFDLDSVFGECRGGFYGGCCDEFDEYYSGGEEREGREEEETEGPQGLFISLESIALSAQISLLLKLYGGSKQSHAVEPDWDRKMYAEGPLLERLKEGLAKYLLCFQGKDGGGGEGEVGEGKGTGDFESRLRSPMRTQNRTNTQTLSKTKQNPTKKWQLSALSEVVMQVLVNLLVSFDDDELVKHCGVLYGGICGLIVVEDVVIRGVVMKVMVKIGGGVGLFVEEDGG